MIVRFWGTRGEIPTPGIATRVYGGNTPCVELSTEDTLFICDAGSGIRMLGKDLRKRSSRPTEAHLFLSHARWDHFQGLPYLDPDCLPNRTLHFHASAEDLKRLGRLTADGSGLGLFPDHLIAQRPQLVFEVMEPGVKEIRGVKVQSFPLNHPGECLGFAFEQEGRKIVYATDHELSIHPDDKFPDPNNESLLLRKMPNELVDLARGAQLLIMDAQYDDVQYAMAKGRGHSSCISVTDFALQAEVKNLALFHHDPDCSDFDLEDRVRKCGERTAKFGAELTLFAAREGVALKF